MDVVRVKRPNGNDFLDLDNADFSGGRHVWVEVAGRLAEDKVTLRVGLPGLHDRQVRHEASFEDVGLAIELAVFLALGDNRADAGLGIEAWNSRPASPASLGKCALRIEFKLKFAGKILPLELLVLAHIGRDHLLHLPRVQQHAETEAIHTGIVGDDGEVLRALPLYFGDQILGNAAQAETARHDRHSVEQHAVERRLRAGIDLARHAIIPC